MKTSVKKWKAVCHTGRVSGGGVRFHLCLLFGAFLFAEEERHEQADDDGEEDGPQDAGDAQLHAQDAGRQDDRQDADGGTGVEEGYGRSQSGPPFVDAGEERQDRTGADGQYAARQGRHRVGEPPFGRLAPK